MLVFLPKLFKDQREMDKNIHNVRISNGIIEDLSILNMDTNDHHGGN